MRSTYRVPIGYGRDGTERRVSMATARSAADHRISAATLDLLRERGPRAVTVEAVAATSGVAKTTIYRRFSDRGAMLRSALAPLAALDQVAPDGPIVDRIRWVVTHSLDTIDDGIGFGGIAALLIDDDPEFTNLFREMLAQQRVHLNEVIRVGIADGQVRPGIDPDIFLDAVVGTYIAERARTGRRLTGIADRTLDLLLPAILKTV